MQSSGVLEKLRQEHEDSDTGLAYFYCNYADSEIHDFTTIIGTLAQQLLIAKPAIDGSISSHIRDNFGEGIRTPSAENLAEILRRAIKIYNLIFIIIDGIDELGSDTRNQITDMIRALTAQRSMQIKVFLTDRDNTRISDESSHYPRLCMSETYVSSDINSYIYHSVHKMLSNHAVIRNKPGLQSEVERELVANAQGM